MATPSNDPIIAKRARIARLVEVGKRVGYSLFGVAVVLFVVGMVGTWTPTLTTAIIACLLIGSVILAPAIIFGFGVKAAEREEQGLPSGH